MTNFDFKFIEFDSWEIMSHNSDQFVKAFEKEQFYKAMLDKLRELNNKAMATDGIDLFRDYRFIKAVEKAEERYKYYKTIADLFFDLNNSMLNYRDAKHAMKIALIK